ncbi:MAG: hypothetical protein RL377_702 [Bacteroidota bacterium]|jgi:hypothetical protein
MFYNPAFYPKAVGYKLTRQVFWLASNNTSFPNCFSGFCIAAIYMNADGLKLTATGIAPAFTGFPFNHFHEPNSSTNISIIITAPGFNY